jgi:peptidoglycan/LPS O-acetylase OafA/YrhL
MRIPNLDPLRGLAAAAVVAHHLGVYTGWSLGWLSRTGGLLGVQLFFLISGYLIARTVRRHTPAVYLWRRAWRIFPAYWTALLLVTPISGAVRLWPIPADWPHFVLNALALGHLSPAALSRYDVLTVSWTLTVEWFWYLLALALAWAGRRARGPHDDGLLISVCVAVSIGWIAATQARWLDPVFHPHSDFIRYAFIQNAAPAQLMFFAIGAAIHRYEPVALRCPRWLLVAVVLLTLNPWVAWDRFLPLNPTPITGIGLAALLVLALRGPAVPWRWVHRLGEIAYPLYLLHVPVIVVLFHRLGWRGLPGLAGILLGIVLAAFALHRLVESPANEWARRQWRRPGYANLRS